MKNNYKIIFFGNPDFAVSALESLVKGQYQIVGVITSPDKPAGRKQIITPPPVKVSAQKLGLEVYQPEDKTELSGIIKKLQPDLAVVAAFGMIFPKEILTIPKYGFINLHPSLLPKYRGPTPIQTAILNGDEQTGVTLYLMDEETDHGPILAQRELEIHNTDYLLLSTKLAEMGAELLIETLPKYIEGKITPPPASPGEAWRAGLPQDESRATYTKKFKTEDAYIEPVDLEKAEQEGGQIALEIDRKIRALNPEPGVFTLSPLKGGLKRIKLLAAKIADGKLKITKIQVEGKKPTVYN